MTKYFDIICTFQHFLSLSVYPARPNVLEYSTRAAALEREKERIKTTKETSQTFWNALAAGSRLLCSLVNELFVRVSSCSSKFDRNNLINCSYIVNVFTSIGYRRSGTLLVLIANITKQLQRMHASRVSSVQVRLCYFL